MGKKTAVYIPASTSTQTVYRCTTAGIIGAGTSSGLKVEKEEYMTDSSSIDFPPSQSHQEKLFETCATFDDIIARHLQPTEPTWWETLVNKPQSLEDKLADLLIVLLKQKPGEWKFTGTSPP